jgi:FkbM family methyltransferase
MGVQAVKAWLVENVAPVRWAFARVRNRELWRTLQAERWVRDALARSREHELADFAFRGGRAYVLTPRGCELLYVPGRRYTTLGMELRGGSFEEPELDALVRLAREASLVLDVGANCGYVSVVLARSNPRLRVHAFEPVASTWESLVHNCRHNGVADRVRCERLAVGERPGTLRMTATLNTGNYLLPGGKAAAAGTEEVEVTTVDAYAAAHALPRVDGIKCDVEGAELFVLRGAAACLERDRPWLLLEVAEHLTRRQGYAPGEIAAELSARGYRWFVVEGGGVRPGGDFDRDRERSVNFLFVHRESEWAARLTEPAAGAAA